MNYKLIKSDLVFHGKMIDLKVDELEYDSGNKGRREIALHPGGAVVVALTRDSEVIFISQFRYPLQKVIFELPAGKLDHKEDPEVCAIRELEEETGFKAEKFTKLGMVCSSPGFCDELLHLYLAENLTPGNHNREEGEQGMQVYKFSFEELDKMIVSGEIIDAKSICGIYLAKQFLNIK
ncbi:MAG: NUDIX hydrolase [Bacteroidota bacterium]|nr:NUDIX hydrolase [Bacteroidota bacterium]